MESRPNRIAWPNVPVIATARLTLRGHRLDDVGPSCAMWADGAVTRFIGGVPSSASQSWMRLLSYVGHWPVMQFGYWAIEDRATGEFVGEVGFADFKREIAPAMRGAPELGWTLAPHAHGKGFATEATCAAVEWADRELAWRRTVCMIDPDNAASIRVAQKCGYEQFERASFRDKPVLFFERLLPQSTASPLCGYLTGDRPT